MKAMAVDRFGGPDVLSIRTMPDPRPEAGQVLVEVHRAGVNYADVILRETGYPPPPSLPLVLGFEGAGIVREVGREVEGLRAGDRVAFFTFDLGGYAERIVLDASRVVPLPSAVGFDEAAALMMQGMTAHYLLFEKHRLGPGTVVLVHAAAGGMGLLLTQWATHLGATVLGTVSTAAKGEAATKAGAAHVIDYVEQDFVAETMRLTDGRGADYIIDGVGKSTFARNLEAVASRGHVVCYGMASGLPEPIVPVALMPRSITVSAANLGSYVGTKDELMRRSGAVLAGAVEGWLRPRIDRIVPLEAASEAHRALSSRSTIGKVLLAVH